VNLLFNISQFLLIIIKNKNDSAIIDNKISGIAGPKPDEKGIK
jgi:hypothetical protein